MPENQPPFAQYPRGITTNGSASQLESLYSAYRNFGWLFLANIVISLLVFGLLSVSGSQVGILFGYVVVPIVIGFLSVPINRKLGYGANWSPSQIIVACVLMGLNSVCCGIVGIAIVQQIAMNHMKRYGLRSGFLGIKKRDVVQKIAELQESGVIAPGDYPRP